MSCHAHLHDVVAGVLDLLDGLGAPQPAVAKLRHQLAKAVNAPAADTGTTSSSSYSSSSASAATGAAAATAATATKPKCVVTFSGLASGPMVEMLSMQVRDLGGEVKGDRKVFDTHITHVVAPASARTLKVLAAGLTGRWIVSPGWVSASTDAGAFVDETLFGARYPTSSNPFRGKRIFFDAAFEASVSPIKLANFTKLVFALGRGKRAKTRAAADIVVVPRSTDAAAEFTMEQLIRSIASCPPQASGTRLCSASPQRAPAQLHNAVPASPAVGAKRTRSHAADSAKPKLKRAKPLD